MASNGRSNLRVGDQRKALSKVAKFVGVLENHVFVRAVLSGLLSAGATIAHSKGRRMNEKQKEAASMKQEGPRKRKNTEAQKEKHKRRKQETQKAQHCIPRLYFRFGKSTKRST